MAEIRTDEFHFQSADGRTPVYGRAWLPADEPRFALQIAHGMADFADRYDEFARFLCMHGGAVWGNDHLGHGHTVQPGQPYGYFAKKDGDRLIVQDMYKLTQLIRERYPNLPLFLFGHSMGSLLARDYCTHYGSELRGAIFSGTSGANKLTSVVRFLARIGILFGRAQKPAKLLSYLAFSKYNDRIEKPRTEKDWLTRDDAVVDAYIQNPWNMFLFTDQAAYDFACLVDRVSGRRWAEALPRDSGYLVISGEMDPVGDYGRGVEEVFGWMREACLEDISLQIYPGARHELTNELNRQEVFQDILNWIKAHLQEQGR